VRSDEAARRKLSADLARVLGLDDPTHGVLGRHAEVIANAPELNLYRRDLAEIPALLEALLTPHSAPHLALHPTLTDDVSKAVAWANDVGLPVVPRGLSSSAYGGAVPARGGLLLDLAAFRTIWYLDEQAMTVRVQAGVSWGDLEQYLNERGLTVHTYPSSRFSTIGGWVATGGLGINSFKYGQLKNWVAKLRVVHPDGRREDLFPDHPDFDKFFATEGQMGAVTGVSLKVRRMPDFSMPHLYYVERPAHVTAFVAHLVERGVTPAHIKLIDRRQMANLNTLHREDHPERGGLVAERDAIFLHVDDADDEAALAAALAECPVPFEEAERYVAGAVWHERFFPMKVKRLGPSLLAAQVIMPLETAAAFVEEVAALGARFGVTMATESYVVRREDGGYEVLVMPMYPCDIRKPSYPLHMLLSQLVTWLGIRRGGRPYAAGLWNSPFVREKYGQHRYAELLAYKRRADPARRFNPGKFDGARGLAGLLLHRSLFRILLRVAMAAHAPLGTLARLLDSLGRERPPVPKSDHYERVELTPAGLVETILGCTGCGDCLPVCPAYLVTGDETVVGRAKLRTGLRLLSGERIDRLESDKTFLCMYCKACQDVCQSSLPLIAAYEAIEAGLAEQNGRPDELIADFIAEAERRDDYFEFIGTDPFPMPEPELPFDVIKMAKAVSENGGRRAEDAARDAEAEDELVPVTALEGPGDVFAQKYHVQAAPAASRRDPIGKFTIDRAEHCINCGQCVRACLYGVHERDPSDVRKLAEPQDHLCRNCFRCVQECPALALTMGHSEVYGNVGRGIYTPDVVHSLATQAERGQIPVTGQGYRGPFSGPGFEGMWTDMSEIVRPTRDGIHGREYISTAVTLGSRPERLTFDDGGRLQGALPPSVAIPLPVMFDLSEVPAVSGVLLEAARQLGTLTVMRNPARIEPDSWPYVAPWLAPGDEAPDGARLLLVEDRQEALELMAARPETVVGVRLALDERAASEVVDLVRAGVPLVYLVGEDGTALDPATQAPNLTELLPGVHDRLVEEGLRDRVTLVARGAIAQAEHPPKAMILGADAVALDWPLLIALECRLEGSCADGTHTCGLEERIRDEDWAVQRVVNLMASWHSQFLEVLGAMGLREIRRLRGERGRAMFADHLEETSFADIIRVDDIGIAS